MSTHFYVYLLLDPRNDYLPFYVGKGRGNRARQHLTSKSHARHNRFKFAVIERIMQLGLTPAIHIWAQDLTEDEAYELEIELIARFKRRDQHPDGLLTNLTNGGEGLSGHHFSEEHRRKIGDAHRGKTLSEDTKAKLSRARTGSTATAKTRAKLSASHKGKGCGADNPMFGKRGAEHHNYGKPGLAGELNGMHGRKHSAEAKRKMAQRAREREAIKKLVRSPDSE